LDQTVLRSKVCKLTARAALRQFFKFRETNRCNAIESRRE
ncbi:hypothetical protein MIMGU_mgv1a0101162mg, partial [Erythranthe guttata]